LLIDYPFRFCFEISCVLFLFLLLMKVNFHLEVGKHIDQ
jgi:hypothetical protein